MTKATETTCETKTFKPRHTLLLRRILYCFGTPVRSISVQASPSTIAQIVVLYAPIRCPFTGVSRDPS